MFSELEKHQSATVGLETTERIRWMTLPKVGVDRAGLYSAGVNPGEDIGWHRLAPVSGSECPLRAGLDCGSEGWYLDAPVKGSPPVFWLGALPPPGWYRDAPSKVAGKSVEPQNMRRVNPYLCMGRCNVPHLR